MRAGLSDRIGDLMQARLYYLQANIALENGSLGLSERLHQFQDFALQDMVVSALGEIPLELWCPEELRRLMEHDRTSSTSYVQTLRSTLPATWAQPKPPQSSMCIAAPCSSD